VLYGKGWSTISAFSKHTKSTLFVYPLPLLSICTIKMLIFACMHAYTISQECVSGVDPGFTKGGAQIHSSEHDNCVQNTHSGMWSMPNLGGLGACPLRKFWKIKSFEIDSEGIFNGLLLLLFQDSTHIAKQCIFGSIVPNLGVWGHAPLKLNPLRLNLWAF